MYEIQYRVHRDSNYYLGYSKHQKEGWSDWIKLKTTRAKPSLLSNEGYIVSNDINLIMRLKGFLEKKQLKGAIRREYKVVKK